MLASYLIGLNKRFADRDTNFTRDLTVDAWPISGKKEMNIIKESRKAKATTPEASIFEESKTNKLLVGNRKSQLLTAASVWIMIKKGVKTEKGNFQVQR